MNALLMDWDTPKALDLVRHLGRAGHAVTLLSHAGAVALRSRFCRRVLIARDTTADGFLAQALEVLRGDEAVFPLVDDLVEALHRVRDALPAGVAGQLTQPATLELTFSKRRMNELAQDLGIPLPATLTPAGPEDLDRFADRHGFPLVVKGERGSGGSTLRMAATREELHRGFAEVEARERQYGGRPFVQAYVPGPLYIVGGLCRRGELLRTCVHRREAEFPLGGPPVMGLTLDVPVLVEYAVRLYRALGWHGLANFQFKEDPRTGVFRFLEINPRPWAFIELAHRAGVDMAGDYCRLVAGEPLRPDLSFRRDVRFVKLLPEGLLYAWSDPRRLPGLVRRLAARGCSTTVDGGDLGPNLRQLGQLLRAVAADLRDGSVRRDRRHRHDVQRAAAMATRHAPRPTGAQAPGEDDAQQQAVRSRTRSETVRRFTE